MGQPGTADVVGKGDHFLGGQWFLRVFFWKDFFFGKVSGLCFMAFDIDEDYDLDIVDADGDEWLILSF